MSSVILSGVVGRSPGFADELPRELGTVESHPCCSEFSEFGPVSAVRKSHPPSHALSVILSGVAVREASDNGVEGSLSAEPTSAISRNSVKTVESAGGNPIEAGALQADRDPSTARLLRAQDDCWS